MQLSTAQQLREIADKIDKFPRFIRRDAGSQPIYKRVQKALEPFDLHTNRELCKAILDLTEELRVTTRTYYTRQFGDDA
jgi:hypothetical protein